MKKPPQAPADALPGSALRRLVSGALCACGFKRTANGRDFTILEDDIFVTSYPRSGNTWMRFLLGQLRSRRPLDFKTIDGAVPNIYTFSDRQLLHAPRPRVLKSHEPLVEAYPTTIYLVRDPRDVAISFYHWRLRNRFFEKWSLALEIRPYLYQFPDREVAFSPSWADHVVSWKRHADAPGSRVLLLKYEDMESGAEDALRLVMSFLGWEADDADILFAVENSRAAAMRQREQSTGTKRHRVPFVRAARSGQWREVFDRHLLKVYWDRLGGLMSDLGYEKGF
jgi:hypothetical protein